MKRKIQSVTAFLLLWVGSTIAQPTVNPSPSFVSNKFPGKGEEQLLMASMLSSFEVKRLNNYTQLTWKTNSDNLASYFLVQRSDDGKRFSNIYEQPAFQNGITEQYTIQDTKAINKVAYYRLLTVTKTGEESLSQVKKVSLQ